MRSLSSLKSVRYIVIAALLSLGASANAFAQEFERLNWFQITFGESLKYLQFLPASNARELPAYGVASNTRSTPSVMNFYKIDALGERVIEKVVIPMSADIPNVSVFHSVLAKDGNRLLIANSTHEVVLFDIQARKVLTRFSGHRHGSNFVAFSEDETKIAVIDDWRSVWIWEVAGDPETPVQVLEMPQWVGRVEFFDGDSRVRAFGEESLSVYSMNTGLLESYKAMSPKLDIDRMHRPESVLMSPDGESFFAEHNHDNGDSGAIGKFNRVTGEKIWSSDFGKIDSPPGWPAMPNLPTGYVMSKNGKCLIVGDFGGYRVLDPDTGLLKWRQRLNASGYYLRLSPDGKYLLDSGGSDVTVYRVSPECGG